ncbi:MAG: prephenate dehydratase [Actinomycetota bacterium]|nr:MAG: prephenate dehydratase [Actinomycetota bacterium]
MKDFSDSTIAYLGPRGTFTEEALMSQSDLARAKLIAYPTFAAVMEAVDSREVDYAFVAIENSIEGTVSASIDPLIFDYDLFVIREVVSDIHLNLMANTGTQISQITKVLSYPHALAQCRGFLTEYLPEAQIVATNSTSEAAMLVAESPEPTLAALAPSVSAGLYNLEILKKNVEDHQGNQTRFFLLNKDHLAPRSGHDKTTVVCFQISDRPGSLISILAQFSARNINLTKLESRPSKAGLGHYCFVIDLEGHIEDPIVADTLAELHRSLPELKLIGSYPSAANNDPDKVGELKDRSSKAETWLSDLLSRIDRLA